jgi:conjugal transfer pilus assembly protein TraW
MWCSRRALVAIGGALLVSLAAAADSGVTELLERSQAIRNDAASIAGEDAARLQAPPTAASGDTEWMKGRPVSLGDDRIDGPATSQQRAWNEVLAGVEAAGEIGADGGPPRPPVPDDVTYVYISLSMAPATLRTLFFEALRSLGLPPVIFVLRGWQPPDLNGLVRDLNATFPDVETLQELPNVQINPVLFRDNDITAVPTFMAKDASGRWGRVMGTTTIRDALQKIGTGHYEGRAIGPTFAVKEPDVLEILQRRLAEVDWQAQVEKAKARIFQRTTGEPIATARRDDSYLVDLTVTVNQSLEAPNGEVFARAGDTINPFDYMTVQTRYVFFDATSSAQRAVARVWRSQHEYTTLVTTMPVEDPEQRAAMLREMGQPVHEVNPALISRFRLREVPAMAYQDGRMLRVDVKGIPVHEE